MTDFVRDYGDLSAQAIENESKLNFTVIPKNEVLVDSEFNSRGTFSAMSVLELAKDIRERGLIAPLIVRPLWPHETERAAKGYKYFLMAGFRRFKAYDACRTNYILASIREVKDEFEACDINAIENLQREELTFLQEARSVRHYWMQDIPRSEVALRISKSQGWVQLRFDLLNMEEHIQALANQGYILPSDMQDLRKLHGDSRVELANRLADARREGKSVGQVKHTNKAKEKATARKVRSEREVSEIVEIIRDLNTKIDRTQTYSIDCFVTSQGNMLMHRVCAWAFGNIDSLTLHSAIKNYFYNFKIKYELPDFVPEMTPRVFR